MAVISAGGLGALMAWAGARVGKKSGDLIVPSGRDDHYDDFKRYLGLCPEVEFHSATYIPGSQYAIVNVTLKPGCQMPEIAPRG